FGKPKPIRCRKCRSRAHRGAIGLSPQRGRDRNLRESRVKNASSKMKFKAKSSNSTPKVWPAMNLRKGANENASSKVQSEAAAISATRAKEVIAAMLAHHTVAEERMFFT